MSPSQFSNWASLYCRVRTSRQKMSLEVRIHTMSMAAARLEATLAEEGVDDDGRTAAPFVLAGAPQLVKVFV